MSSLSLVSCPSPYLNLTQEFESKPERPMMCNLKLCLLVLSSNVALGHLEPEDALPQLKYDYSPKGNFDNIDGLPIYVSDIYMPGERKDIGRCVVWAYDIFGWVSPGRGFEMVDLLNRQTGMITVFPDFFRGEQYNETYQWDTQLQASTHVKYNFRCMSFEGIK